MRLLMGKDPLVAEWVRRRIPHMTHSKGFGQCVAIGVINEAKSELVGGVVFHDYRQSVRSIEWSAASDQPNWLNVEIINQIMRYPFDQLNCVRITAIIPRRNKRSRAFQEKFGFRQEGLVRRGFGGDDACIYGLLASDWKKSRFNLRREVKAAPVIEDRQVA